MSDYTDTMRYIGATGLNVAWLRERLPDGRWRVLGHPRNDVAYRGPLIVAEGDLYPIIAGEFSTTLGTFPQDMELRRRLAEMEVL